MNRSLPYSASKNKRCACHQLSQSLETYSARYRAPVRSKRAVKQIPIQRRRENSLSQRGLMLMGKGSTAAYRLFERTERRIHFDAHALVTTRGHLQWPVANGNKTSSGLGCGSMTCAPKTRILTMRAINERITSPSAESSSAQVESCKQ